MPGHLYVKTQPPCPYPHAPSVGQPSALITKITACELMAPKSFTRGQIFYPVCLRAPCTFQLRCPVDNSHSSCEMKPNTLNLKHTVPLEPPLDFISSAVPLIRSLASQEPGGRPLSSAFLPRITPKPTKSDSEVFLYPCCRHPSSITVTFGLRI